MQGREDNSHRDEFHKGDALYKTMHKYSWAHDPHGDIIKGLATVTQ